MPVNWFHDPGRLEFRCFGLLLSPLCVGHLFSLRDHDSPYIIGGNVRESDVRLAAIICSALWSESRRFLTSPTHGAFRAAWKLVTIRRSFSEEHVAFSSYLEAHQCGVDVKVKVSMPSVGPDTFTSPFEWIILMSLTSTFGMTYAQAMDTPVWIANRLMAANKEVNESLEIVSDELDALFDYEAKERVNHHGPSSKSTA